jgi:hypothetical protein
MFLALQYGIMCALSFATIITMFASAIAVVLLLVMIACRSICPAASLMERPMRELFQGPPHSPPEAA